MTSDFLGFDFLSATMGPAPDLRRGYTADAVAMPDLRRGYVAGAAAMPVAGATMTVDATATQGIIDKHLLAPSF